MTFFKILLIFAPIFACISNIAASPTPEVFVPLTPQGNVASVTNPTLDGDRRLFYQSSNGTIIQYDYTGFFGTGSSFPPPATSFTLVPAAEALHATPIAAVWQAEPYQVYIYFLSPAGILSEYFWDTAAGWNGGPSCSACLTQYGFQAVANTAELYATADSAGRIAVGFVSAGSPRTISEAVRDTSGSWTVNALS